MMSCIFCLSNIVIFSESFDFHVAPMVGYTDRHFRYLLRLLHPKAVLWTEMLKPKDIFDASDQKRSSLLTRGAELSIVRTTNSDSHGPRCVLQLGGDSAEELVRAIHSAEPYDYSEINLNCGCPSIESHAPFGAALMRRPDHVAYLLDRMAEATRLPVSVKCRIGIHESAASVTEDDYRLLYDFLSKITASKSCSNVVIHARSAILQGLSPSANRSVPPLRYDFAVRAAGDFPEVSIAVNGGLDSVAALEQFQPTALSGAMAGRWCISRPLDLLLLHSPEEDCFSLASKAIDSYCSYAGRELQVLSKDQIPHIFAPIAILLTSLFDGEDTFLEKSSHCGGAISVDQTEELIRSLILGANAALTVSGYSHLSLSKELESLVASDDRDSLPKRQFRKIVTSLVGKKFITKLRTNTITSSDCPSC